MKKVAVLILYLSIIAATRHSGLSVSPAVQADEIIERVKKEYRADLQDLGEAIEDLRVCAESVKPGVMGACRTEYLALREKYKEAEVLLDYLDHSSVALYFNGPPLPTVEPKVPEVHVLEPEGIQVIDEIIMLEPNEPTDVDALREQLEIMTSRFDHLVHVQATMPVHHHHVWNGLRTTIIRLATLGITGFDTPGSSAGIDDARITLETMRRYFRFYEGLYRASDEALGDETDKLFAAAIKFTKSNNDFDTFDRLTFTRDYLNPLFCNLYHLQKGIGIEFPNETADNLPALNLHAKSLYDINIYDKDYYTNMEWEKVSDEKIELGKTLFFDPVLSQNMDRSCASCHHPARAFTDGYPRSLASEEGKTVLRNAPTLVNCVFTERFFYDMREPFLERQIKHVVMDTLEFNTSFMDIVERLQKSSEYREMFAEVYPNSKYQLSKWSVSDALAAYVANLTSFNAPFDKYIRAESDEIDPAVARGFNLFMGKAACGSCHFAPAFNGTIPPFYQHTESEVLGTPATPDTVNAYIDPDPGRKYSGRAIDEADIYLHAFKTPTVRNIALTAPYMHNGVYTTLEEVVDFYNRGGGVGLGFEVPNQTLPFSELNLTKSEVADLVAFMESLTDVDAFQDVPERLPAFDKAPDWDTRLVGGEY